MDDGDRTGDKDARIGSLEAAAYRIPTAGPEADGTLSWDATTLVVVRVRCGAVEGLGWTYADAACVDLVHGVLASAICGRDVLDVRACWHAMQRQVRNLGRVGLVSCAISAVDVALWDAAARLLDLPLSRLLGRVHPAVDVYASGGFTTYDDEELSKQLEGWVQKQRIPRVKIKIGESWGSQVARDLERVRLARSVIGPEAELYVDANGGYTVGQAVRVGQRLAEHDVSWFEEPVSSDDLAGLHRVRSAVGADVTAGEYGYDLPYFARMLDADAVDCVQVDVTRCGGFTEWSRIAALAAASNLDVSAHCAPNLSAHAGTATANFRHIEWFADHDRIERDYFDGGLDPSDGSVRPTSAPGHGMTFRSEQAEPHRVG
ncbi:MAG TPA: enolase C-terminal domain-like protein [Actinopolymorphaceae bacterium]|jgi:L-alanine-DL-glutamate epimerase-like enolase superfamily enzyme|nr:enolase C-terminal domain-like protein [Actinopolymorphaceae bacterium]